MCKQPLSEKHADDSVCSFLCHRFQLRTYPIISLLSGRPGTGIPITGNASAFADPKQTLEQEAAQPRGCVCARGGQERGGLRGQTTHV